MAQEYIDVGASANDGQGDPLRTAFQKTNNNFTQLFQEFSGNLSASGNIVAVGNITGGNIYTTGVVSALGNIEVAPSNYFVGNGYYLTGLNIPAGYGNSNVATYLPTYSGNIANLTVTGNLTVIGNTTTVNVEIVNQSETVVGNITGGNILTSGRVTATGNIVAAGFQYANGVAVQGSGAQGTTGSQGTTGAGTQGIAGTNGSQGTTGTQGTIGTTGVGTQGTTGAQGTTGSGTQGTTGTTGAQGIQGPTGSGGGGGGAQGTTGAQGATGTTGAQGTTGSTGAQGTTGSTGAQGTTGSGTQGTTGAQGATGNPFGGGTFTGTITTQAIVPSANVTYNIGSPTAQYSNIYAVATSALYADLAECYLADADYAPGTVLSFGGNQEVTMSTVDNDSMLAGVVSTAPAYTMNSGLKGDHVVVIALAGRVPCVCLGPVKAGDFMVSDGTGRARSESNPNPGAIIGKAIKGFNADIGVTEILVGRF